MRVKSKIYGSGVRPRLSVYKSNTNIYAQLIDDSLGKTLVTVSSLDKELKTKIKNGSNIAAAKEVGRLVAGKASKKGIKEIIFDRNGFLFHGRIKALADMARENGLKF